MFINLSRSILLLVIVGAVFAERPATSNIEQQRISDKFFHGIDLYPKARLAKKTAGTQRTIKGYCYAGPGTGHPIDSGNITLIMWNDKYNDTNFFSNIYADHFDTLNTKVQSGSFTVSFDYTGQVIAAVKFPPYAIQWFNGESIHEQPTEVLFEDDTISRELHFMEGCRIRGSSNISEISCDLIDTCGIVISHDVAGFNGSSSFDCIPVGTYYLTGRYFVDDIGRKRSFYPGSRTLDSAEKIVFHTPGQTIDGIVWNIVEDPPDTVTDAKVIVKMSEVVKDTDDYYNPATYYSHSLSYTCLQEHSLDFNSTQYEADVKSGQKFFLTHNILKESTGSPDYRGALFYPGTGLRSQADTFCLSPGETLTLTVPKDPPAITWTRGTLPPFMGKHERFIPVLTEPKAIKSLGASFFYTDYYQFTMLIPSGVYSMWFVPFYLGYSREKGQGAFGVKNAYILDTLMTNDLPPLESETRYASIVGTVRCSTDAIITCYDTTGRCASLSFCHLYDYLRDQTGDRWKCFDFVAIDSTNTLLQYVINYLPVGKYALAAMTNLPIEEKKPVTVRWYKGPVYTTSIFNLDDFVSLSVPDNVTYVEITDPHQTLELNEFVSGVRCSPALRNSVLPQIALRHTSKRSLYIDLSKPALKCTVRIFDLKGRLLESRSFENIPKSFKYTLPQISSCKTVICNVNVDDRAYTRHILVL